MSRPIIGQHTRHGLARCERAMAGTELRSGGFELSRRGPGAALRLGNDVDRTLGATPAAGRHTQFAAQLGERAQTAIHRTADLGVGDAVAQADVHEGCLSGFVN